MRGSTETMKEYLTLAVPILIGGYLFLNPFPHVTALREISFYLSILLVLILAGTRSLRVSFRSPLTAALLLYIIWSFASVFWAGDRMKALHDFYTHLLAYVIFYYMLVNFFTSRKRVTMLMGLIALSTALFSIGAIVYFYPVMGNALKVRLYPDHQVQPNMIGIIVSFGAMFSLLAAVVAERVTPRIILYGCFFANLCATALTYSRGALIALALSMLLFFSANIKRLLLILLVGILILSLMVAISPGFKRRMTPRNMLQDGRISIVMTSLEIIKEHPLRGIGFDMKEFRKQWGEYNSRLPKELHKKRPFSHTHNFILDVTVRTGIIGLALFSALLIICVERLWRLVRRGKDRFIRRGARGTLAALAGLLTAGMAGNIMNNHKSAILLYIVFAFMTILWILNESFATVSERPVNHSQAEK